MMKRFVAVAGVVAVMASSAFASWDYFPPKESGGEARLEFDIGFPAEKVTQMDLMIGARYTIIPGLEASLKIPMELSQSIDGDSYKDVYGTDYFGINYMPLGVRYWLMDLGLGFFVDALIPLGTADRMGDPDFDMNAGVQYSMNVTEEFAFGAELQALLPIPEDSEFGMTLGLEAQYSIGAITPFLGLEMDFALEDYKEDMDMELWLGASYEINDMIGVDASVKFNNLLTDADVGTTITIGVSVNF